jgi:hypothetical protein
MAKNVATSLANAASRGAASSISTSTGISQDNIIFGMLLLLFIVFITLKGELRTYMGFFTPSGALGPAAVPVTTGATASIPGATQAPLAGGTIVPSGVPGVPGLNTSNPFAGIPILGSIAGAFTGNSTAGTVQQGATSALSAIGKALGFGG